MRVYVAGPPYAEEYRRRAAELLREQGHEPVDPMRRDFRGRTEGNEQAIVEGDLEEIDGCEAVLAAFTAPDEGTAMEAWYALSRGKPVVAYTGGTPAHPWTCTSRRPCTPTSGTRCGRSSGPGARRARS